MLLNCVKYYIENNIALFQPFQHVYLFGSLVRFESRCNDIDILLLYTTYSEQINNSILVISKELEEITSLRIDITALSVGEEKELQFLLKLQLKYIQLK